MEKTKQSQRHNLYSSSIMRRMHGLNGLFKTLFAVISQHVLHFSSWQAKYIRIYTHHFKTKYDFIGFQVAVDCPRVLLKLAN